MATLSELRTRLDYATGQYGAIPSTAVQAHMNYALNDALRGLARRRKWFWWLVEDTSTLAGLSSGTETSDMPSDIARVECILNPDGEPVEPKTPHRQLHYPEAIGKNTTTQTYAMGGINSATRVKSILWSPALLTGGDYVLWYYRVPADLTNDTDVPDLPDEFHDYLYWRALSMLHLTDEERGSIIDRAKAEALEIYADMEAAHARNIETLTRRIYAVP